MNRRNFAVLSLAALTLAACGAAPYGASVDGPGMSVTFSNAIKGKKVDFIEARTASGRGFPNPGSLSPDKNPMTGGKTMGAAPDGRALPEWIEFDWKEWPYPRPKSPPFSDKEATKAWSDESHALSKSLSIKTERVLVRARVPQDVIDEVMESNRQRQRSKLADKSLEIYFIWFESGIKFRWRLVQGCCKVLREGGDVIDP